MKPNLTYINNLSGDDLVFKQKLINVLKEEFPLEKNKYFMDLKANDLNKVADDVHKLKHKISVLGINKSYKIAEQFENNLREGATDLKEDFENILTIITDYLEEI